MKTKKTNSATVSVFDRNCASPKPG